MFEAIPKRAEITLTFPVIGTVETHAFEWKQSDFWQECTDPGSPWKAAKDPVRYVCRFRGNTLMDTHRATRAWATHSISGNTCAVQMLR